MGCKNTWLEGLFIVLQKKLKLKKGPFRQRQRGTKLYKAK
jgi:hypothetical protein